MNPFLSRRLFYRAAHAFRGEQVQRCEGEIERFYSESPRVRADIHWGKLSALLEFSYRHNRYYRDLLDRHGVRPEEIRQPDDLRKIPVLRKEDLQGAGERILSTGAPRSYRRRTSGSTGIPLVLKKDRIASSYMAALTNHVYGWYGIRVGDRQARIWGVPFGLRQRWVTSLKHS